MPTNDARSEQQVRTAPPLFRLRRKEGQNSELLGYEWIEVLAIEGPSYFARDPDVKTTDHYHGGVFYVCRTPNGLTRIDAGDLWHAIEKLGEYEEA